MQGGHESTGDAAADAVTPTAGWLAELSQLGRALRRLFGAQLQLLAAELGLARSAVSWMLAAALAATAAAVGLGLTVLGLLGVALAQWLGSWIWALLVLALLQLVFLVATIVLFRRCMHWMSLPATRGEWAAMIRGTVQQAEAGIAAQAGPARQGEEGGP
ncbi:MAG: ABC transporter ATP-binding protein [Pseudomonadota bacterium]|nr:ABC transporter ATP-binding protein [Xanthomonadaceae bacterium]MDE2248175.1 ABC transporter ATP-binding protein [Xanthomonadaceae bacterium]MDE3209220.1 ABC transporter ATP-binding protein [Pseudomonadota bacterium]